MASPFKQTPVTCTAVTNAASKNGRVVKITTESLTTAVTATYTCTLTNICIAAASAVTASVCMGTAATGLPAIATVTPGAGTVVIVVQNIAASGSFNGTLVITVVVH